MLGRLGNGDEEKRMLSFQAIWGSGDSLGNTSEAGVTINADTSFNNVAFFAAINLISGSISTLPVDCFVRRNGSRVPVRPKPAWVDRPDLDLVTGQAHWQQVLVSLLVYGNAYVRIFRDKKTLDIVNLVALDPNLVTVSRGNNGRKIYTYSGEENKSLTSDDILHITDIMLPGALKGKGRIDALADSIGLGIALQSFAARFFGGGTQTAGIIEFPGNLQKEQAKSLVEGFDSAHRGFRKAHRTGILSGGAKWVRTTTENNANQFLESREFSVLDVARAFQIPTHMLGVTTGSQARASVEQLAIDFVTNGLRPHIEKLERAYSTLLPNQEFIKFNIDGLIRADFSTRMQGYSIAIQGGWLNINDIHRLEDLPPVEGGDVYRVPLANVDLAAADLVAQEKQTSMAAKLIQVGFAPEEVLAAMGLPAMAHTGIPNVQLQPLQNLDPNDPLGAYEA
jgi:HK97 family phage portal protein